MHIMHIVLMRFHENRALRKMHSLLWKRYVVHMLLCHESLEQGEIYILVWGYMHEIICIVTHAALK
jgi:hypothetical protein